MFSVVIMIYEVSCHIMTTRRVPSGDTRASRFLPRCIELGRPLGLFYVKFSVNRPREIADFEPTFARTATTLKSLDYNVVMTFRFNNNK